jgi:hypothetical protein
MDLGGGAVCGAATLAVLLALAITYTVVRLRHGRPPPHASEQAHTFDGPRGDHDEIPRESGGGMPMPDPGGGAERGGVSPDEMRQRARGNGG